MSNEKLETEYKEYDALSLEESIHLTEFDDEEKTSAIKRWYSFNKQKIPMYFILMGTFFFTAFLDFNMAKFGFKLDSHFAAINKLLGTSANNLSSFYVFMIYLISIIQAFNAFTFSSKQNPVSTYLITTLTVVQAVLVSIYSSLYFIEASTRTDGYVLSSAEYTSMTVFIVGTVFFIIGTIFCWVYVNFSYERAKDE